ncbi:hypothetical protein JHK82_042216 [Glycine max]|nr:hypothetical protein JHK86_042262 [Glycine max]KAG4956503.1 hypothetical protein JHK85_042883 [Glycine max]KAG5105246.1 hypothetical protein JHK82_042216 [Glycine max]KAG5116370.1 hypothetical protein JHK84_042483 [Glycine max]
MFIGDKRCQAIETVMESLKTVCCNAKHGCNAIVRYSEKREHEKTCIFVPCLCPQPRCDWISNSNELGQHFNVKHFYKRISFKYGEFFYVSLRRDTRRLVFFKLTQELKFEFSLATVLHIPIEMWSSCNGQIKLQFLITTVSGAFKVVSEQKNELINDPTPNGRPKRIRNRPAGLDDFYP